MMASTHGKYFIKDMIRTINKYTNESNYPILKELCYKNSWDYDTVIAKQRDSKELSLAIKRLMYKREAVLEKGAQNGDLDRAFSIFVLKQPELGWTDKSNVNVEVAAESIRGAVRELTLEEARAKLAAIQSDNGGK